MEDKATLKVGDFELVNSTGNAIKVVLDHRKATIDIVACCIGEGTDH